MQFLRAFTDDFWVYSWFLQWFMSAKLAGVIAMFASILVLLLLPWLDRSRVRSSKYRPVYKVAFWVFVLDCIILGCVGGLPAEGVLVTITQWATFLLLLPFDHPGPRYWCPGTTKAVTKQYCCFGWRFSCTTSSGVRPCR